MKKSQMNFKAITEKGFTLVELLIVVIILAILAAIVVPQFASTTDDARSSAADSTLAGMRSAIDIYYQQHNNTYPGAVTAVPPGTCTSTTKGTGVATGGAGVTAADAFLDQLSFYTDVNGGACSIGDDIVYKYGPYLKKRDLPSEPFADVSVLEVVAAGDLAMPASANPGPGGYLFDSQTGKIIINLRAEETR